MTSSKQRIAAIMSFSGLNNEGCGFWKELTDALGNSLACNFHKPLWGRSASESRFLGFFHLLGSDNHSVMRDEERPFVSMNHFID